MSSKLGLHVLLLAGFVAAASCHTLLFLDKEDALDSYGRIRAVATSAQQMPHLGVPKLNYTAGATVFASFDLGDKYEVFVAVGRPGEPLLGSSDGVSVLRFTSTDLVSYSDPVEVMFLENGSGGGSANDGSIWTVKSMDRDQPAGAAGGTYLLLASYATGVHSFICNNMTSAAPGFTATTGSLTEPNFSDHDDANVFYNHKRKEWNEMQIMYQTWDKKYCDNVLGARRVVTVRNSRDGAKWSDDWGCLDNPQTSERCQKFNTTAMVTPNSEDPPELEFYRIRPFVLGSTGRVMAHVLLYVPAPSNIVLQKDYGRQPLWYCKDGCCHGPHMYEEWWVGPASGDVTELSAWRRPYFDTRAFPHDVWAMGQPLVHDSSYVWVDSGLVWGVPEHRMAGLNSVSNAEFSTASFRLTAGAKLWVNAELLWGQKAEFGAKDWCEGGCNGVGGSDEARSAYLMAELLDASTSKVIRGFEKEKCVLLNQSGKLPLSWTKVPGQMEELQRGAAGKTVQLRFYFRDATVFAAGFD